MTPDDIIYDRNPFLTIVTPKGKDGSSDHIVCVVDDLIFDARLPYALMLTEASFDWVCGRRGMAKLGLVARFCKPAGVKKRKKGRTVKENW
jgi:hypothetical protein